jgi:hypothetical protein
MLFFLTICVVATLYAQTRRGPGISEVTSSSSVNGNSYSNSFFGLSVETLEATFTLNPTVFAQADIARLVQINSKNNNWVDTFTFAVVADSLARHPQLQSPAQYVRSVLQQRVKKHQPVVKEEFPITISGLQFTGTILEEHLENGRKYYHGLYVTFRRGYILSFDAEASSPDKLNALVQRSVKFTN